MPKIFQFKTPTGYSEKQKNGKTGNPHGSEGLDAEVVPASASESGDSILSPHHFTQTANLPHSWANLPHVLPHLMW
jgi:hypothetical protein